MILPLRQRITDEMQLRYNGMLAGVFGLLRARRDELRAEREYVEALREYWLTRCDVDALLSGVTPEPDRRSHVPSSPGVRLQMEH